MFLHSFYAYNYYYADNYYHDLQLKVEYESLKTLSHDKVSPASEIDRETIRSEDKSPYHSASTDLAKERIKRNIT